LDFVILNRKKITTPNQKDAVRNVKKGCGKRFLSKQASNLTKAGF